MIFDPKSLFDVINRKNQVNLYLNMAHAVQPLKLSKPSNACCSPGLNNIKKLSYCLFNWLDIIAGCKSI